MARRARTARTSSPRRTSTNSRSVAAIQGAGRRTCWEGGRSRGLPGSSQARLLDFRPSTAITTGRVFRARCGPIRWAIRRLASRTACSGSTPRRSCHRPVGEYGDAPVAPFRLPGRHQWDFAVSKTVSSGWHDASAAPGRPDQRVQPDAVSRCRVDAVSARRHAPIPAPDSARLSTRARRVRSNSASGSTGDLSHSRSTLVGVVTGLLLVARRVSSISPPPVDQGAIIGGPDPHADAWLGRRPGDDHEASSTGEGESRPRTSRGRCWPE